MPVAAKKSGLTTSSCGGWPPTRGTESRPRNRERQLEEFVSLVVESWRASGGEPDVALDLPEWLREARFRIESLRPIIDVVTASDYVWQWPASFIESGLRRLIELGRLDERRAQDIGEAFEACERRPGTLMITPAVLEIIAVREPA